MDAKKLRIVFLLGAIAVGLVAYLVFGRSEGGPAGQGATTAVPSSRGEEPLRASPGGSAKAGDLAAEAEALSDLQRRFAHDPNGVQREEALFGAASVGTAEAVAWLVEVAASDDPLAARAGAALGAVVNPAASASLVDLLDGKGSVLVRANAARALGRCGGKGAEERLLAAVGDSGEALRIRQEAARSLGQLGSASSVPKLNELLISTRSDGSDEQLRLALVEALSRIGGEEAAAALRSFSGTTLTNTERAHLARFLGGPAGSSQAPSGEKPR